MKNGMSKTKITIASILGSILTLQLGAFSVIVYFTVNSNGEISNINTSLS